MKTVFIYIMYYISWIGNKEQAKNKPATYPSKKQNLWSRYITPRKCCERSKNERKTMTYIHG